MSSEESSGYVHDPGNFGDDGERVEEADRGTRVGSGTVAQAPPADPDREFGWRGWILVGAIAICFLVVPATILYIPYTDGLTFLGLPYIHTLIALPMIPAVALGILAVWATTRP